MNLITVIPCHSKDAVRSEKLLDLMLYLQDKQPDGYGILALSPDVPQEMRDKLRITAELVFTSVEVFNVPELPKVEDQKETKTMFVEAMFEAVARRISKAYKEPWIWVEPDTTPVSRNWKRDLACALDQSPKRYLGGHLAVRDAKFLSYLSINPPDCLRDLQESWSSNIPFRFYALDLSAKTPLVQNTSIKSPDDTSKVREDAVLVHGDKDGLLIPWVIEKCSPKVFGPPKIWMDSVMPPEESPIEMVPRSDMTFPPATTPKKRGRPPKRQLNCVAAEACQSNGETVSL